MKFKYKVADQNNNIVSGEISAIDKDAAVSALQDKGYVVLSVAPVKNSIDSFLDRVFRRSVPMKDMVMMIRQLAVLVDAQVPVVVTLNLVASNTKNKRLSEALKRVSESVQGGKTIAESMAEQKDIFSDLFVNMIGAGEESGNLRESLLTLADYIERQFELNSKIKNAMIYPAFVITAFIGVLALMLTVIIPKMGDIIKGSGVEVPGYTQFVLSVSDFMVNSWYFLLIGLFVIAGLVFYFVNNPRNRRFLDRVKLSIPGVSNLFKMLYLSRIAFNMYTLFRSGVPVIRTMEITASLVGNKVYEDILNEAIEKVKGGSMISAALAEYDEMPEILVQMMRVGEESGSITLILKTLGDFYKKEVDNAVDTIIGMIEPAMIVFLGGAVGVLLASVMLPIYNIAGSIS